MGRLDLDYVGAELVQEAAAGRSGESEAEVEHAVALERVRYRLRLRCRRRRLYGLGFQRGEDGATVAVRQVAGAARGSGRGAQPHRKAGHPGRAELGVIELDDSADLLRVWRLDPFVR